MTIQEFKDFFSKSNFSEIAKSKIMAVLEGKEEVGAEVFSKVREIMQAELDADFNEAGVDISTDAEAQAIKKEYEDKLEKIETELNEDMSFVEGELKELEDMRQKVMKVSDEMDADKIRQSM